MTCGINGMYWKISTRHVVSLIRIVLHLKSEHWRMIGRRQHKVWSILNTDYLALRSNQQQHNIRLGKNEKTPIARPHTKMKTSTCILRQSHLNMVVDHDNHQEYLMGNRLQPTSKERKVIQLAENIPSIMAYKSPRMWGTSHTHSAMRRKAGGDECTASSHPKSNIQGSWNYCANVV